MERQGGQAVFVPDLERNVTSGRYFRVGGSEDAVFYGLGQEPVLDALWPNYTLKPELRRLLEASPGAVRELARYDDTRAQVEGVSRLGWLLLVGGSAAVLGGLAYDYWPGNAREMQRAHYWAAGGVAGAGLALFGGGTWAAHSNYDVLEDAIAAYNRDPALRRPALAPSALP